MAGGEGEGVWAVEIGQHGVDVIEKLFWHEEDAKRYVAEMNKKFPNGFPRKARVLNVS